MKTDYFVNKKVLFYRTLFKGPDIEKLGVRETRGQVFILDRLNMIQDI